MADQTAASLAATLLGLQRKRDPLQIYQDYGKQQMAAGSSTAPLGSGNALEGIARALQGGIGGLMQGYGMAREEQKGKDTVSALGDLYNAKTDAERADIIKNYKGDSDIIGPIAAQLLGGKQQREALAAGGTAIFGAPPDAATPPASGAPVSLGSPGQLGPIASGGSPNPNNIGNVRPNGASTGFQQPPDFGTGVNLTVNNAKAYPAAFNNGQPMTLAQIGQKWAPVGDGANDPMQWAKNVSAHSGLPLDQPLDLNNPQVAASFARGVHGAEWGAGAVRPVADYGGALAQNGGTQSGSASPAPPPLPSLKPTPEEIATVRQQYNAGAFGRNPEEAGAKAVTALHTAVKDRVALEESRAKMGYETQQKAASQAQQGNIDVGNQIAVKTLDDYNKVARPQALAATQDIQSIHQMRQLIDQGVFSGSFAPTREALSRAGQFLNVDLGADTQANTAALRAAAGGRMGAIIKQYGSGSGISDADIKAATARIGGDVTQGEEALRKILKVGERESRNALKNYDTEVGRLQTVPALGSLGKGYYTIPEAPSFEDWSKANPALAAQGAPVKAATDIVSVQTPDEARKLPSGTKIRLPDGSEGVVP